VRRELQWNDDFRCLSRKVDQKSALPRLKPQSHQPKTDSQKNSSVSSLTLTPSWSEMIDQKPSGSQPSKAPLSKRNKKQQKLSREQQTQTRTLETDMNQTTNPSEKENKKQKLSSETLKIMDIPKVSSKISSETIPSSIQSILPTSPTQNQRDSMNSTKAKLKKLIRKHDAAAISRLLKKQKMKPSSK